MNSQHDHFPRTAFLVANNNLRELPAPCKQSPQVLLLIEPFLISIIAIIFPPAWIENDGD